MPIIKVWLSPDPQGLPNEHQARLAISKQLYAINRKERVTVHICLYGYTATSPHPWTIQELAAWQARYQLAKTVFVSDKPTVAKNWQRAFLRELKRFNASEGVRSA